MINLYSFARTLSLVVVFLSFGLVANAQNPCGIVPNNVSIEVRDGCETSQPYATFNFGSPVFNGVYQVEFRSLFNSGSFVQAGLPVIADVVFQGGVGIVQLPPNFPINPLFTTQVELIEVTQSGTGVCVQNFEANQIRSNPYVINLTASIRDRGDNSTDATCGGINDGMISFLFDPLVPT